ncbi:actin-interacting protein 1 [Ditylenchus destructor]|nr:actin-interacting protein 1 [Ditylenchus destructor]
MASDGEYTKECTFASLPRTTRGMPIVISASPDSKKFLYCNGNSVYIRDVEDVSICDIYTEHSTLTTVAKYAPSGFYIASGDQSGKVRIWDTTQSTHILKAEYPVISGPIRDIAWSDDSKRIAVVGEGRERFGHVFLFDTGTSNGNLSGQSRAMTSIDFRNARPYRLVSASEDNTVAIFEGPPFKFKTLFHEHTRFVNCIRYNTDGSVFASAGADGRVVLFEGGDGTKIGELLDEKCNNAAHGGGVFGLAWESNGNRLVTASADKTVKIWNTSSKELLGTATFGNAIEDQQVSVTWLKDVIVSVALSGFIHYIDPETCTVSKILKGHSKPITALTLSVDKKYAFTADFEGHITRWDIPTGLSERITPQVHKAQISGLVHCTSGTLVSVAWDDSIAFTNVTPQNIDTVSTNSNKLTSQPRGVASLPNLEKTVIAGHKTVTVFAKEKQASSIDIKYEGTCVDIHPEGKLVAVGGQDSRIRIYELKADNTLTDKTILQHQGALTSVRFSPNGKYLVGTDNTRKVIPYDLSADFKIASEKEWSFHSARVNCCAWSPNNRHIATGGIDTNIIIWDLQKSGEHPIIIKAAHPMSPINCIEWISETRLITAGQDSNVKQWTIKL